MAGIVTKLILKSKLQKGSKSLSKAFLPWDNINKIALIISVSANVNKSAIDRFIAETKKFVEVFYVETKSKQPTFADWNCFLKKDKSLFNLPKKHVEEQLSKKQFDLVINTSSEDDLYSAALLCLISAPLKCASGQKWQDANLVVNKKENTPFMNYLNEIVKYLQMIRVN